MIHSACESCLRTPQVVNQHQCMRGIDTHIDRTLVIIIDGPVYPEAISFVESNSSLVADLYVQINMMYSRRMSLQEQKKVKKFICNMYTCGMCEQPCGM